MQILLFEKKKDPVNTDKLLLLLVYKPVFTGQLALSNTMGRPSMSPKGYDDAKSMNFSEKTFISIMFVHEIELTVELTLGLCN